MSSRDKVYVGRCVHGKVRAGVVASFNFSADEVLEMIDRGRIVRLENGPVTFEECDQCPDRKTSAISREET